MSNSLEFLQNDYVVYPSHGVGKIEAIEKDSIAGFEMEMFVIHFATQNKLKYHNSRAFQDLVQQHTYTQHG